MDASPEQVKTFETIESLVATGKINSMSDSELRELKQSLITNTPTSSNPRFEQRWQRAYSAISSKLEGSVSARRFRIQIAIGIVTLSLVIANLYFSHFYQSNVNGKQQQESQHTK